MTTIIYALPKRTSHARTSRSTPLIARDRYSLITVGELVKSTPKGKKIIPLWYNNQRPQFFGSDSYHFFDNVKDAAEHIRHELAGTYKLLNDQAKFIAELIEEADQIYMSATDPTA